MENTPPQPKSQVEEISIKISEDLCDEESNIVKIMQMEKMGSGGKISLCAQIFFRFIECQIDRRLLKTKRALEIGSGTGVVGICVSCLGIDVVLSDISTVKRALLDLNCAKNAAAAQENGGKIRAIELDWVEHEKVEKLIEEEALAGIDLIIGSDLILNSGSLISLPKVAVCYAVP